MGNKEEKEGSRSPLSLVKLPAPIVTGAMFLDELKS
jgi:hypothetical protein